MSDPYGEPDAKMLARIREQVDGAVAILRRKVDVQAAWKPRELQEAAQAEGFSSTVSSLAFWSLVEDGTVQVDNQLIARRA